MVVVCSFQGDFHILFANEQGQSDERNKGYGG